MTEEWMTMVAAEWQPIETAPPGIDDVLVSDGSYVVIATHDYKHWLTESNANIEYDYSYPYVASRKITPTHWMPLPKAPNPTRDSE